MKFVKDTNNNNLETKKVTDKEADDYYNSRPYKNKIGAWASSQSEILNKRAS